MSLSAGVSLRWWWGSVFPSSVSPSGSNDPVSPFLHRVLWGEFPGFGGTTRDSDSLPLVLPHFVAFAWQYHSVFLRSLPRGEEHVASRAWSLVTRSPTGSVRVETTGPPRFLGDPHVYMPCSHRPRWSPRRQAHCDVENVAFRSGHVVGLHVCIFRGSVTWPARLLFTLRSRGYPRATQNSLPVGGPP